MAHPVHEQDAVGEGGQRVVERLVLELLLERPPLGDVAAVDDDAGHGRVVEQVLGGGLQDPPRAVGVARPQLERAFGAGERAELGERGAEVLRIVRVGEDADRVPQARARGVAQHPLHGRALVGDPPVPAHDHDHVGRVRDQRSEPPLARLQLTVEHPLPVRGRRGQPHDPVPLAEQDRLAQDAQDQDGGHRAGDRCAHLALDVVTHDLAQDPEERGQGGGQERQRLADLLRGAPVRLARVLRPGPGRSAVSGHDRADGRGRESGTPSLGRRLAEPHGQADAGDEQPGDRGDPAGGAADGGEGEVENRGRADHPEEQRGEQEGVDRLRAVQDRSTEREQRSSGNRGEDDGGVQVDGGSLDPRQPAADRGAPQERARHGEHDDQGVLDHRAELDAGHGLDEGDELDDQPQAAADDHHPPERQCRPAPRSAAPRGRSASSGPPPASCWPGSTT